MTYVIANFEDVTEIMVADCKETSIDTLRHTWTGIDRVLLKYDGDDPAWVATLSLTKYSYSEILTELASNDWNPPELED